MSLTLMAAISLNNAIGRNGDIPWKQSSDLKRFKELTEGKIVVMGRKTWDSLPRKPLPNRPNWILSRSKDLVLPDGARLLDYQGQVIEAAQDSEVIVIGGSEIYEIFMPFAQTIELTTVHTEVLDADAFFPEIDTKVWYPFLTSTRKTADEKNQFDYHYTTLKRYNWELC